MTDRVAILVLGFTVCSCHIASADVIDISANFNRDTIAVGSNEPINDGYRDSGEVFVTEGFSGVTPPGGGVNLPDPIGGFGELDSAERTYRFGPYDNATTTQLNTWIIPFDSEDTLDIPDQRVSSFGVLFSAVGYNPTDSNNGTATVTYTDLTQHVFVWDVADSNGDGFDGLAAIALGSGSPSGMDLFNTNSNTFPGSSNRMWFTQEFTGLDETKTVNSLTLSTAGVGDSSGDAEFGIYAISASVDYILGDMDGDNLYTPADIPLFVQALVDRSTYDATFPALDADLIGDVNQDGTFNLGDLKDFKGLFIPASSGQSIPEPSAILLIGIGLVVLVGARRLRVPS